MNRRKSPAWQPGNRHSPFTDKVTEALREAGSCPTSHNQAGSKGAGTGFSPSLQCPQNPASVLADPNSSFSPGTGEQFQQHPHSPRAETALLGGEGRATAGAENAAALARGPGPGCRQRSQCAQTLGLCELRAPCGDVVCVDLRLFQVDGGAVS